MRTTEFQRDDEDVPVKTQLLATHAGEDGCLRMLLVRPFSVFQSVAPPTTRGKLFQGPWEQ